MEYKDFPTVFFELLHLSMVQKFTYKKQILSTVLIYITGDTLTSTDVTDSNGIVRYTAKQRYSK
jgi:hypothetical protein